MEGYLSCCVQRSLSLFLYDDARFLAERLVAASPSEVRVQNALASLPLPCVPALRLKASVADCLPS
jgi:hypothetical protein